MKDEVQKRWGTPEQYYKKLEEFHEQHSRASYVEYDNEMNCPVKAVYYFEPYTVVVEHYRLMEALRKECEK